MKTKITIDDLHGLIAGLAQKIIVLTESYMARVEASCEVSAAFKEATIITALTKVLGGEIGASVRREDLNEALERTKLVIKSCALDYQKFVKDTENDTN